MPGLRHSYVFINASPHDNRYALICSKSALCILSVPSHRILKRFVLKGWDLIKLIILIASLVFSEIVCGKEEYSDLLVGFGATALALGDDTSRFSHLYFWPSV